MKTILFLLCALLVTSIGEARIGETYEECVARYGEPNGRSGITHTFSKGAFTVHASFSEDGKCQMLRIIPHEAGGIPKATIEAMLAANSDGAAWVELTPERGVRLWRLGEQDRFASYDEKMLLIGTMVLVDKKAEDDKAKASGF